ncbi:MAG TPA: hypothetical protein DCW68_06230 [Rhodospirillaceae bacterium]|nr:MAG: hypothetical protein A2018_03985 [Alphaproteobacteria bacterium GWF2_58_20]HAU29687.1 hypothetical protein [Rhodospirillaceae bacterium]
MEKLILVLVGLPVLWALPLARRTIPDGILRFGPPACFLVAALLAGLRFALFFLEVHGISCHPVSILSWPMDGGTPGFGCTSMALFLPPLLLALAALASDAMLRLLPHERSGTAGGWLSALVMAILLQIVSNNILQSAMAFMMSGFALAALMAHWHEKPACRGLGLASSLLFMFSALMASNIAGDGSFSGLKEALSHSSGPGLDFGPLFLPNAIPAAILLVFAALLRLMAWADASTHGKNPEEAFLARLVAAFASLFVILGALWQMSPFFGAAPMGHAIWGTIFGFVCIVCFIFMFFPNMLRYSIDSLCEMPVPRHLRQEGLEMAKQLAHFDDMLSGAFLSRIEKGLGGFSSGMREPRDLGHEALSILLGIIFFIGLVFWAWGWGGF